MGNNNICQNTHFINLFFISIIIFFFIYLFLRSLVRPITDRRNTTAIIIYIYIYIYIYIRLLAILSIFQSDTFLLSDIETLWVIFILFLAYCAFCPTDF